MKEKVRVSVAMATYNGEKYLEKQIDSILLNLKENDELVISDDGSTDGTIKILNKYLKKDTRIKIINGPKLGIKKNFENAISYCSGKYIFLADQDDIWMKNKVDEVLKKFEIEKCSLVIHDAVVVNENLEVINKSFFDMRNSKAGIIKNIYKNSYIGCCMAFESNMKRIFLPIPNNIEMHDQWIGILNELFGKSIFLEKKLIKYRRHQKNNSSFKHYPVLKMLKNRIVFIKEFLRRKKNEKNIG